MSCVSLFAVIISSPMVFSFFLIFSRIFMSFSFAVLSTSSGSLSWCLIFSISSSMALVNSSSPSSSKYFSIILVVCIPSSVACIAFSIMYPRS